MKVTKRQLEFLKKLESEGIEYSAYLGIYGAGGMRNLSVDEVVECVKDINLLSKQIACEYWSCSMDDLHDFIGNGYWRCKGVTRRGTRCKLEVWDNYSRRTTVFNPEIDFYCRFHSRLG